MAAGAEIASPRRMRTTFAGTRLQALSIIFVRSFSACVVGRRRIRRPPAIRSPPYRPGRGGQTGRGFLRKERAVLRRVPEELRERVRRHLYEARARAAAAAGECTAYGGHVRGGVSSDMSHIRVPI